MVNLALYRHYEVLKRGTTSVNLSLAILATLAGTILLFFKFGLYEKGEEIGINLNLLTSFTFSVFIISAISVIVGFFVSDSETKKADYMVSNYFLAVNGNPSTLIQELNKATNKLEMLSTICNGLNMLAALGVVGNYIIVSWPFLSFTNNTVGKHYLYWTVFGLVVIVAAFLAWWFSRRINWA